MEYKVQVTHRPFRAFVNEMYMRMRDERLAWHDPTPVQASEYFRANRRFLIALYREQRRRERERVYVYPGSDPQT